MEQTRLSRRLGTSEAVVLGLGSMIGAGIFAAAAPAAQAAGSGLLLGLLLASLIAFLNATTMAQLAAAYPESGGTYVYGRKLLGNYWGFLAGWGFVIGKLASCTAMALTFAHYAAPAHAKSLAIGIILLLTLVNYFGVKKTANVTRLIVAIVLLILGMVVFATLVGGSIEPARLTGVFEHGGVKGVFEAAGILFFAFAGYARIATLGEEVINPGQTIPKAIILALSITLIIYAIVMSTVVLSVDIDLLAAASAPLALAVESGRYAYLSPIVRIGAAVASVGVLLSLMAGIGRTMFAMAANADLPKYLSAVHPVHKVPHHAEVLVGIIIAIVVSLADVRSAIGFSSFSVLVYYAIANAAALKLPREQRRFPKWMSTLGFIVCVAVALSMPAHSIIGGLILFALGSITHFILRRRS